MEEVPPTADDVRGAPVPGDESGRADRVDTGDGAGRYVGRALLWIPRLPFMIAMAPLRGLLYVQARYSAVSGLLSLFVTDDLRFAVFPTAFIATGFGLNVGAGAFAKDLLGLDDKISLRVGIGGETRWRASAKIVIKPHRRLSATVAGLYERRDAEPFYGYGNGDIPTPGMLIDPLTSDAAQATRFGVKVVRVVPRLKVQLPAHVSVTATAAVVSKSFDGVDHPIDPSIETVFMTDRVPGFNDGVTFVYPELELAWDTRRQKERWDGHGLNTTGSLVLGFAGYEHDLDGRPGFLRAGFDLQQLIRLSRGPRVLQLRTYGEMVTGARDEVPFSELPRLGGENMLRGYPIDRFRDRVAIVAQATYRWAVASWLVPALFVDAGRVYSGLDEVSLKDPRVGFGFALEVYSRSGLALRSEIASSIDGGVFLYLSLNPAFDARARVER
ncbi:MAG: hypothetical protein H0V17_15805 [Deltaproteobacteria bacterium]|nr:hypothetical protein [Deltaproteobacteria bacterium]